MYKVYLAKIDPVGGYFIPGNMGLLKNLKAGE
jgi:hypothetical protein